MISKMRIVVLTSLYPTSASPHEGIFAERRWQSMRRRGNLVDVVQPLPYCPPGLRGRRARFRGVASREVRNGITIVHPRYLHTSTRRLRWAFAASLPHTAGWCAVAQHLVDDLDPEGGLEGRGCLTPNGVDTDLFRPRSRATARQQLGVNRGDSFILCVGHRISRKDPLLAVESLRVAQRSNPEVRLVLIGEGPLRNEVQKRICALGLAESATVLGEQSPEHLAQWYAASDLLLLCSSYEGRPNVVLESLASGRPVLATASQGTREVLNTLTKMIVDSRKPEVLGARMIDALARPSSPDDLCQAAAEAGWDRASERLEECLAAALRRVEAS